MSELIYPTLDLYVYDLRESLGETEKEIDKNREKFQAKIAVPGQTQDRLSKSLESLNKRDRLPETEYVELLENKRLSFETQVITKEKNYPLKGYYYPVRMNDTYGLLIDCSVEPPENLQHKNTPKKAYDVSCFEQLKTQVNACRNDLEGTVGETWVISGELPTKSTQTPEEIARECYQKLMPGAVWDDNIRDEVEEVRQGFLYGGSVFELWGYDSIEQIENNPKKHHVIIAIYPNEEAARKAAALNYDWMRLWGYRHKIMWAYNNSVELKTTLKIEFIKIQEYTDAIAADNSPYFNLKLLRDNLVKAQHTLANYSTKLSDLDDQTRTIEINLINYRRRLQRINKKIASEALNNPPDNLLDRLGEELKNSLAELSTRNQDVNFLVSQLLAQQRESHLKFMETFSETVEEKYLLQVQKDYGNFSPGLQVLGDLINSIRGITEIDQAKRDRIFQNNIAIVGVGAGAASVAASASASYIVALEEIPIVARYVAFWQLNREQANLVLAVNFSIVAGVLVAVGTALAIKFGEWMRGRSRN